jgi:hypothetical protein
MAEEYGAVEALGMIETRSYPAMVEAADAMVSSPTRRSAEGTSPPSCAEMWPP